MIVSITLVIVNVVRARATNDLPDTAQDSESNDSPEGRAGTIVQFVISLIEGLIESSWYLTYTE